MMIVQRDVVGDVIVELRRAGFCGFRRLGHCRQRLDIEHHSLAGVARLCQRLRHHERYGIADKTDLVGHQRGTVGLQQRGAIAALERQTAGERSIIGRREVGPGPHPEHAGHGFGGRGIDAADDAMGVAGADDPGIGLARQVEVVGVFALATHQRVVFLAADGLPDAEFLQCDSVFHLA